MHRHPNYYPIRNHLIEFLVNRSQSFQQELASSSYDPKTAAGGTAGGAGSEPSDVRAAKRKVS